MRHLHNIGLYFIMINKMFHKPTKWSVMKQLILKDIEDLVINSLGIIAFVSFFIGGTWIFLKFLSFATTGVFLSYLTNAL